MIVDRFTGEVLYNPGTGLDEETMDRLESYSNLLGSLLASILAGAPAVPGFHGLGIEDAHPMLTDKVEVDQLRARLEVMTGTNFGRDEITVQFRRVGAIHYLSAHGEFDCPACGRIHTENEVLSMASGAYSVNWCPCGTVWMELPHGVQILGDFSVIQPPRVFDECHLEPRHMDNNVRYLLRTTETHIGGVNSHGDLWELFYLVEDGKWVVDEPAGPGHYCHFEQAWEVYWAGRNM